MDIDISPQYIRPDYRLTLDYPEDLEFFKRLFDHFGENTYRVPTLDIIRYLDENPQIVEINKHCEDMYRKRLETQSKLEV